jgi:CHAT domain-containing protein/tetratricopeptide (TPR) repeat protein
VGDRASIPQEVVNAVLSFVNAKDPEEIERVLLSTERYLLTDLADEALQSLIEQHRDSKSDVDFLRDRRALLHRCREFGIHRGIADAETLPNDTGEVVLKFLNVRETAELMQFVREKKDFLLSPDADLVLDRLSIQYKDDDTILQFIKERRDLLHACRFKGIEKAFGNQIIEVSGVLNEALGFYLGAPTESVREVLEEKKEVLLSEEAETVLAFVVEGLKDVNDENARHLRQRFALLRACRARGLAATFDSGRRPDAVWDELKSEHPAKTVSDSERNELGAELHKLSNDLGAIDEESLRHLLRNRSELADALREKLTSGEILWTASDHTRLKSLMEQVTRGLSSCDWVAVASIGSDALKAMSVDDGPELWGAIHWAIGTGLSRLPQGDRADNLDRAIEHHNLAREALKNDTGPVRTSNEHHLALAYLQRVRGDRAENIEVALSIWRQLIDSAGDRGSLLEWEVSYADGLRQRQLGDPVDNIEKAIAYLRTAITRAEATRDKHGQLRATIQLGIILMERPSGDSVDNVEQALDLLSRAVPELDPAEDLISWANSHRSLAMAYVRRTHGDVEENWQTALDYLARISEVCPKALYPELWAENQLAVATLYDAHPNGATVARRIRAAELMEATFAVYTIEDYPDRWAKVHTNLGSLYSSLFQTTDGAEPEYSAKAITHLENALRVYTRERAPERWATVHGSLGRIYVRRAELAAAEARWAVAERAVQHFRRALEVRTAATNPAGRLDLLEILAALFFRHNKWREALGIYVDAMKVSDKMLASAHTEAGRLSSSTISDWLYDPAAYCLFQLNDLSASLVCAEWGKSRVLSRGLALRDLDIAGLPGPQFQQLSSLRQRIRALEFDLREEGHPTTRTVAETGRLLEVARRDLVSAVANAQTTNISILQHRLRTQEIYDTVPSPGAVVVPLITSAGSVAFIILRDVNGDLHFIHISLNWVDTKFMRHILVGTEDDPGWIRQYRMWRRQVIGEIEWRAAIRKRLALFFQALVSPIATELESRLPEGAPLTIVPGGTLSFLPSHAASDSGDGISCLLDRFNVAYSPSIYALQASHRRRTTLDGLSTRLLAVINPTSDLEFAESEGKCLETLVASDSRDVLRGEDATIESVEAASRRVTHLHFACHGSYNPEDASNSGLALASSTLTIRRIVSPTFDLSTARLVTLSACESGLIDTRFSSDEFIGLPTAFLQGGACGVISTLWPIDDYASSLLMRRFYHHHLAEGVGPGAALRNAQLWLRNVTSGELEDTHVEAADSSSTRPKDPSWPDADERPYADPYYWAPFYLTGT